MSRGGVVGAAQVARRRPPAGSCRATRRGGELDRDRRPPREPGQDDVGETGSFPHFLDALAGTLPRNRDDLPGSAWMIWLLARYDFLENDIWLKRLKNSKRRGKMIICSEGARSIDYGSNFIGASLRNSCKQLGVSE